MFKPHRFNPLLKARPNRNHEQKVASGLVHGHTHEALKQQAQAAPAAHAPKGAATAQVQNGGKGAAQSTEILSHVHATVEGVATVEMTPPHPPREETPAYAQAHHHLTKVLDSPCAMCGVRNSTLHIPAENPFGATALETHHYPIERSLLDACDPKKIGVVFPQVKDRASLEAFVDSENNLMVLCDIHHRDPLHGIHHLTPQDFFIQPFLIEGYEVVVTADEEAKAMAADEKIVERAEKKSK